MKGDILNFELQEYAEALGVYNQAIEAERHHRPGLTQRNIKLTFSPVFSFYVDMQGMDNRPYLRCLKGKAICLAKLDRHEEAIETARSTMHISDNHQGMRELLCEWLFCTRDWDDVQSTNSSLSDYFRDEAGAEAPSNFHFPMALFKFWQACHGLATDQERDDSLVESLQHNPWFAESILDPASAKNHERVSGGGSKRDAEYHCFYWLEVWRGVPGALDWLRKKRQNSNPPCKTELAKALCTMEILLKISHGTSTRVMRCTACTEHVSYYDREQCARQTAVDESGTVHAHENFQDDGERDDLWHSFHIGGIVEYPFFDCLCHSQRPMLKPIKVKKESWGKTRVVVCTTRQHKSITAGAARCWIMTSPSSGMAWN
jgi:hypothetical protein